MKKHIAQKWWKATKITEPFRKEQVPPEDVRKAKKALVGKMPAKRKLSKTDLSAVLVSTPLVCGNRQIADLFAKKGKQKFFEPGDTILSQNAEGDSFFLILSGRVSISVNSRIVAYRTAGDFVGETCILAPCKKRMATVVAADKTRLLELSRSDMAMPLEKYPCILKCIAATLSDRLNERGMSIQQPNQRPELFIGSSRERRRLVEKLANSNELKSVSKIKPWTGIFPLTLPTLDALLDAVGSVDFALLILSADDIVNKRDREQMSPRDNVILELGLFLGVLGKERTVILVEEGVEVEELALPSDLAGITYLPYKKGAKGKDSLSSAIHRVAERIKTKWTR